MGGAECLTVVVAGSESLGVVGTDIGVPCLYHCKEKGNLLKSEVTEEPRIGAGRCDFSSKSPR
jgi:hypothetical protein